MPARPVTGAQGPPAGFNGSSKGEGQDESLIGLLNPLVSMIVLPYLGSKAARRELERSMPETRENRRGGVPGRIGGDPLRDLDMRLTYRRIRVLLAIGELERRHSRPSNRQVADASGIRDQGQVSKLLARLRELGLIENASEPRVKGEPNAWRLTERGREVRAVLSA